MVLDAFHSFKVVANSWPSLKNNGEFLQWLSENGPLMRSDPTAKKAEAPREINWRGTGGTKCVLNSGTIRPGAY